VLGNARMAFPPIIEIYWSLDSLAATKDPSNHRSNFSRFLWFGIDGAHHVRSKMSASSTRKMNQLTITISKRCVLWFYWAVESDRSVQ
jgi:hypothetical protein